MEISVKVKPNSKQRRVEKIGEKEFVLWIREPAKEGKANEAAVALLSEYFGVPKSAISITRGHKSRNKYVRVGE